MKRNPSNLKKLPLIRRRSLIMIENTTDLIMKAQYQGKKGMASILGIPVL